MRKTLRAVLVIGALACGGLAAWVAGSGSSALADTVTGTTGDISYSVTWTQGPGPNQMTLVVSNTASSSGEPISDFDFQINDPNADVTGTSGGGCSTNGVTPNEVTCGSEVSGGQSETITITTQSTVSTGTTAKIIFRDGAENPQPPVVVTLQAGTPATTTTTTTTTGATTTATGTTTTTTGSTTTTTTPAGRCDWSVAIDFSGAALVGGRWIYTVTVTNKGTAPCPAANLTLLLRPDKHLTEHFNTVYLASQTTGELGGSPAKPLTESVPPLAPGASVRFKELCAHAVSGGYPGHSGGLLKVFAEMPIDADGSPNDETATVVTHVVDGWQKPSIDFAPAGASKNPFAEAPLSCGAPATGSCKVSGRIDTGSCSAQPGGVCGGQAYPCMPTSTSCTPCTTNTAVCTPCTSDTGKCGAGPKLVHGAAGRKPAVLGQLAGSVRGGRTGPLTVRLNARGVKLLRAQHKLKARVVLDISAGGVHQALVLAVNLVLKR